MSVSTSSLASKSNISKESRTLISMQSELILIAQIPYVPDLQLFLLISSQILINVHVYVIDVVKLLLREGCVDAVGHLGLGVFRWTGDLLASLQEVILLGVLIYVYDRIIALVSSNIRDLLLPPPQLVDVQVLLLVVLLLLLL